MKIRLSAALLTLAGGFLIAPSERAQDALSFTGSVHVLAYEASGRFLGMPEIRIFETWDHKDLSERFHEGAADSIPFGVYRMEVFRRGCFPETRYVSVFSKQVTVIVGLSVARETNGLPVQPMLHGRVKGLSSFDRRPFVKLVGLYSSQTLEASIATDGQFEFSIPRDGRYLLMVVSEDGLLASREITSPYSGPPLEVEIGSGAEHVR
jgi:hypothetical protein